MIRKTRRCRPFPHMHLDVLTNLSKTGRSRLILLSCSEELHFRKLERAAALLSLLPLHPPLTFSFSYSVLFFLTHKATHRERAAYWFLKQQGSKGREWHLCTHMDIYVLPLNTHPHIVQTCISGNKPPTSMTWIGLSLKFTYTWVQSWFKIKNS